MVETLEGGWNVLEGATKREITAVVQQSRLILQAQQQPFGDGHAAEKIACVIKENVCDQKSSI